MRLLSLVCDHGRMERDRERERDGRFFGIFILKSVDFSNLYSNLFETVGRWLDICIYSSDYWRFVTCDV